MGGERRKGGWETNIVRVGAITAVVVLLGLRGDFVGHGDVVVGVSGALFAHFDCCCCCCCGFGVVVWLGGRKGECDKSVCWCRADWTEGCDIQFAGGTLRTEP